MFLEIILGNTWIRKGSPTAQKTKQSEAVFKKLNNQRKYIRMYFTISILNFVILQFEETCCIVS